MTFFTDGGIWMILVALLGLASLATSTLPLAKRGANLTALAIGLIAATFLMGIAGSGMGLYQAAPVISGAAADQQVGMLARALGIALTTTTVGALLGTLSSIFCGVTHHLRKRAVV